MEKAKPYQHPNTIHREGKEEPALTERCCGGTVRNANRNFSNLCASVSRPQPLSTITKRSASDKVMSRAGFINNVMTKIEEVWLGKGATPQSSPAAR